MSNYLSRTYRNYLEDHASLAELTSYYGMPMTAHRTASANLQKPTALANGYTSSFKAFGTAPGSYVRPIYDDQVKQGRVASIMPGSISDQRKTYANIPFTSVPPPASMSHLPLSSELGLQQRGLPRSSAAKSWPSNSRSVITSNLDPNSKPFSPRSSSSGANAPFFDMDKTTVDKDSNANLLHPAVGESKESKDLDKALLMKKIWVGELPAMKQSSQKAATDAEDCKMVPPQRSMYLKSDANANIIESGPEDVHSKKISKSSEVLEADDKYGLKAMLKAVKTRCPYIEPELEFIDQLLLLSPGKPLFEKLDSPFNHQLVTVFNSSYEVPEEYSRITTTLSGKLHGPGKMVAWPSDMLFFFFYMAPGEMLQLFAGNILHLRGWRYVKNLEIWIARKKNFQPLEKTEFYESGEYQFFDRNTWKKEFNYFTIYYSDLADRSSMSSEECKSESDQMIYMMMKHYGSNGILDMNSGHPRPNAVWCDPLIDANCPRGLVASRDLCAGGISTPCASSGSSSKVF